MVVTRKNPVGAMVVSESSMRKVTYLIAILMLLSFVCGCTEKTVLTERERVGRTFRLRQAVGDKDQDAVREILARGGLIIDVSPDGRWTPLTRAAMDGQEELAKLLLEHGANIEANDGFEQTPLVTAAKECQVEMVRFLLGKGAKHQISGARYGSGLAGYKPPKPYSPPARPSTRLATAVGLLCMKQTSKKSRPVPKYWSGC